MKTDNVKIERSSGNVFADLGLPDAEGQLLKAELVTRIDEIIRRRGLKQVEAARVLSLTSHVSCGGAFGSIRWSVSYAC